MNYNLVRDTAKEKLAAACPKWKIHLANEIPSASTAADIFLAVSEINCVPYTATKQFRQVSIDMMLSVPASSSVEQIGTVAAKVQDLFCPIGADHGFWAGPYWCIVRRSRQMPGMINTTDNRFKINVRVEADIYTKEIQ